MRAVLTQSDMHSRVSHDDIFTLSRSIDRQTLWEKRCFHSLRSFGVGCKNVFGRAWSLEIGDGEAALSRSVDRCRRKILENGGNSGKIREIPGKYEKIGENGLILTKHEVCNSVYYILCGVC